MRVDERVLAVAKAIADMRRAQHGVPPLDDVLAKTKARQPALYADLMWDARAAVDAIDAMTKPRSAMSGSEE